MKTFVKPLAVTLLTAATLIAPITGAQAGDWRRFDGDSGRYLNYREYDASRTDRIHRHNYRRYRSHDDAIVLGIIGLTAGALIGGAIAESNRQVPRRIYRPEPLSPGYYPDPPRAVQYDGGLEPWSKSWYRYCKQRYRSFNASTGTYRGYDGQDHFCVAN